MGSNARIKKIQVFNMLFVVNMFHAGKHTKHRPKHFNWHCKISAYSKVFLGPLLCRSLVMGSFDFKRKKRRQAASCNINPTKMEYMVVYGGVFHRSDGSVGRVGSGGSVGRVGSGGSVGRVGSGRVESRNSVGALAGWVRILKAFCTFERVGFWQLFYANVARRIWSTIWRFYIIKIFYIIQIKW